MFYIPSFTHNRVIVEILKVEYQLRVQCLIDNRKLYRDIEIYLNLYKTTGVIRQDVFIVSLTEVE